MIPSLEMPEPDRQRVVEIGIRAKSLLNTSGRDALDYSMFVGIVHKYCYPLDLDRFLAAPVSTFIRELYNYISCLDRTLLILRADFIPNFAIDAPKVKEQRKKAGIRELDEANMLLSRMVADLDEARKENQRHQELEHRMVDLLKQMDLPSTQLNVLIREMENAAFNGIPTINSVYATKEMKNAI